MGDSDLDGHHPTPKLPIFLMPLPKPPEPPGLLTPPLHPGASVPFHWEEVPGRPLPCLSRWPCQPPAVSSCSKRCLDLPLRLLHDKQSAAITMTNHVTIPSPTSILEDPYSCPGNRLASTWSFRLVGSRETMPFGSQGGPVSVSGPGFLEEARRALLASHLANYSTLTVIRMRQAMTTRRRRSRGSGEVGAF